MWCALGYMFSIAIMARALTLEPSSGVCSKYDYEEKLLERVIRNELALKDTLYKITETHVNVVSALKSIKEEQVTLNEVKHALEAKKQELVRTIDSVIHNVSNTVQLLVSRAVKDMEETKKDLKVNFNAFVDSGSGRVNASVAEITASVTSLVEQTSKELSILRDQSKAMVMFFARQSSSGTYANYAQNQDVVYNTVLVNEGKGYDPNTGHFTASVAGLYLFSVQYCAYKLSYFELVHEGKPVQSSVHGDANNYVCVTMQGVAKVSIGEKVRVRCTSSGNVYQSDSNYWNTFAGMLIHM